MSFLEVLLIAVGLAMDAFAVSAVAATAGWVESRRPVFRLAFHFGLFQALMPIIGWAAGQTVIHLVQAVAHWVAFAMLALVGGRMILSGWRSNAEKPAIDPTRGTSLVMLSLATSIDAMAVGVSLSMLRLPIIWPAITIGVVTAALCLLAIRLGRKLGMRFGSKFEILGGLVLLFIGVRILVTH